MRNDFMLDFETLSLKLPTPMLLELAIIPFESSGSEIPGFNELVNRGKVFKFDIKAQRGTDRTVCKSTIEWWKEQSDEVRKILKPTPNDLTIQDAIAEIKEFLYANGFHENSKMWCRGLSFDPPIFSHMFNSYGENDPFKYHNQRDIRTAIDGYIGRTSCPLVKGTLPGFKKHNSIDDCAKDIIMLMTAKAIAMGEVELPEIGTDLEEA